MYIIIAFACIYQDGIEVSGQTLTMYISYNDQSLALNQNPAHLWPVTVMFVLFYLKTPCLPGVGCRMCSSQRRHPASSIPEKRTTWLQVEKKVDRFFSPSRYVLGFCFAAVSQSTPPQPALWTTAPVWRSVKVAQVFRQLTDFWQLKRYQKPVEMPGLSQKAAPMFSVRVCIHLFLYSGWNDYVTCNAVKG